MIQSLSIKNFQSHKKTKLNFSRGVNIIVGKTDSGKSGVIRSLNWIVNNKPNGDSFRSSWGGETTVSLSPYSPNIKIKRIKDDNRNEYQIESQRYKAFGQNVPDNIKKILNLSEINFQYQMDSPFLFSKSPGEVARFLNESIDIDIIDSALSNIARDVRDKFKEIIRISENKRELKSKLKEFIWIKDAEKDIKEIEILERKINSSKEKINKCNEIIERAKETERKLFKSKKILCLEDNVTSIIKLNSDIEKKRDRINYLTQIVEDIKSIQGKIRKLKNNMNDLQEEYKISMGNTCPLCLQKIK